MAGTRPGEPAEGTLEYFIKALGWMNVGVGLLVMAVILAYVWATDGYTSMVHLLTVRNVAVAIAAITPGVAAIVVGLWMERR